VTFPRHAERFALAPQAQPWRQWYGLRRWRNRAAAQLRREPLCAQCLAGGKVVAAQVADHHPPHRGDWNAFRLGPLQSLCFDCHKRKWADDSHGYHCDIGDDGMPIDASHPFNQGGCVQHAPTADEVVDIARDLVRCAQDVRST
jgi:hypothetical protein